MKTCNVVWPLPSLLHGMLHAAECQLPKGHDGPHHAEYDGEVYERDRMKWESEE